MNASDLCLIIDNDRDYLAAWLAKARMEITRGTWGEDKASEFACIGLHGMNTGVSGRLAREAASLAFARIDWAEVAEHYRTKVEEGVTA